MVSYLTKRGFPWRDLRETITLAIPLIAAQVALGQPYNEAHTASMLLAFLVYLVVFCWAYAASSLARVWTVLLGGALLMTGAGWLLQSFLA